MEYKDIKTADELESWYAEKQAVLDSHARDYMVPFGFVYHLDCSGYVSFERWNDTLPTAEEQTAFQAIQNGVSTKEIIEPSKLSMGSEPWKASSPIPVSAPIRHSRLTPM